MVNGLSEAVVGKRVQLRALGEEVLIAMTLCFFVSDPWLLLNVVILLFIVDPRLLNLFTIHVVRLELLLCHIVHSGADQPRSGLQVLWDPHIPQLLKIGRAHV